MEYHVRYAMHLKHQSIGYLLDAPSGNPFYTFYHFINPVDIRIDGRVLHAMPNACCLFEPGYPIYIHARNFPLLHDYVCFDTSTPLSFELINTVFYTVKQEEVSAAVEDIQYNLTAYSHDEGKCSIHTNQGMGWLINLITGSLQLPLSASFSPQNTLTQIRQKMYASVREWSVENMLQASHLSRPMFYRKYREWFHVSPNEDRINASLLMAENLLLFSDLSITDIAEATGYNSADYFIRRFRKRYGLPPGDYRKTERPV